MTIKSASIVIFLPYRIKLFSFWTMASNKRALRSGKRVTSEYFLDEEDPDLGIKSLNKDKKKKIVKHSKIKLEYEEDSNQEKVDFTAPSEEKSWKPPHWEEVYDSIVKMRSKRDAAVDHMGAEKCSDKDSPPEVQRFHTLIGLMLSSQTKDNVTHAAVMRLKKHGLTVENILNTPVQVIEKIIYPVGFYKRKADYIVRTCKILKEKYDCDIPSTVEELCSLPGVGKKMAYICMDIAWDKMEGIGVDTHVHRISNRLGWTGKKETKTPEETRKALEAWLPKDYWREANLLLVGFGQQICLPVYPKCSECLVKDLCPYGLKNIKKSPKAASKNRF